MTDAQADEVILLLRAICKAVGGRVPRTAEQAAAKAPDQKSSVSVVRLGRGHRLVPETPQTPWDREARASEYPTSTTTRERFWKETR